MFDVTTASRETPSADRSEGAGRAVGRVIDLWLGSFVEILGLGSALVAAEIVILLAGVVSRYLFDQPLVWSDELASILFLWLAMLGAAIALRRSEHMRKTAVVAPQPK
jgi:TRAP-type C4-dicarboxylate transport system permease small subunit